VTFNAWQYPQKLGDNMKVKAFGKRILGQMINPPGLYKKSKSGLLIADKDMDESGIKPRWFKIYSVGDDVDFCTEGDYVLVAHGRWSRGVEIGPDEKVWLLDNDDCLAISNEPPAD
tara:strand:- start:325 stop:672 length:348 start_codon:yes stop_codon:yes gene_type:complete